MAVKDRLVTAVNPGRRAVRGLLADNAEKALPKVYLDEKNIENCQLLLNRAALLRELPKNAVCAEIGVDQGDFTEQILAESAPKLLHLVDNWATRDYREDKFNAVQQRFAKPLSNGQVHVHRKLSLEAVADFADDYFDWIYLDTTHTYQLTAQELRAYAPKVKAGGIIAGHDYSMGNWGDVFRYGVIEAVSEFCVQMGWRFRYLTMEPIENQSFALCRI